MARGRHGWGLLRRGIGCTSADGCPDFIRFMLASYNQNPASLNFLSRPTTTPLPPQSSRGEHQNTPKGRIPLAGSMQPLCQPGQAPLPQGERQARPSSPPTSSPLSPLTPLPFLGSLAQAWLSGAKDLVFKHRSSQRRAGICQRRGESSWGVPALPRTSFSSPTSDLEVMGELLLKSGTTEGAERDGFRKTRAHPELNLVRDVKGNKKGIYKYTSCKRKIEENVVCCLMGQGIW
ncbi:hypothetical protein QYF61_018200 [Mycteria americana]|uniref:Uncharacterized protein n=1 Tax=Mycteria americana TaxID=33587 RepID=A0AAN7S8F4_MYCAM|nr:hypothetical protein QYF61_018200 [Mycteria americana]